jgi:hypothetical protein
MVERALALRPEQGAGLPGLWLRVGMAMRAHADVGPHRALAVKSSGPYGAAMAAFLDSVRKGDRVEVSERLLATLPPPLRAYAYSAAIVVRGRQAPQAWRDYARRLLFAPERPYFT